MITDAGTAVGELSRAADETVQLAALARGLEQIIEGLIAASPAPSTTDNDAFAGGKADEAS